MPVCLPPRTLGLPVGAAPGVEVWDFALDLDAAGTARLAGFLDADERARAARFRFERDRCRWTVARGFLRQKLGERLDIPPGAVRFRHGPRGKPALWDPPAGAAADDLRFNLSHSGGRALCALAGGREIGVDLECGEHLGNDLHALAARIFSPPALTRWRGLPAGARRTAFLCAWTRKEAFLKATGEGLVDDLGAVEVAFEPGAPAQLVSAPGAGAGQGWRMVDLPLGEGWAGALVVARGS